KRPESVQQRPAPVGVAAGGAARRGAGATGIDRMGVLAAILGTDAIGLCRNDLAVMSGLVTLPANRLAAGSVFQRLVLGFPRPACFPLAQACADGTADEPTAHGSNDVRGYLAASPARREDRQASRTLVRSRCAASSD